MFSQKKNIFFILFLFLISLLFLFCSLIFEQVKISFILFLFSITFFFSVIYCFFLFQEGIKKLIYSVIFFQFILLFSFFTLNYFYPDQYFWQEKKSKLWNPTEDNYDQIKYLSFNYNSKGWRSIFEQPKFNETKDLALIGDSFAFGIVNDNETIESYLYNKGFNSILTLALPGASPMHYQRFVTVSRDFSPSFTYLFLYIDNDFNRKELRYYLLNQIIFSRPLISKLGDLFNSIKRSFFWEHNQSPKINIKNSLAKKFEIYKSKGFVNPFIDFSTNHSNLHSEFEFNIQNKNLWKILNNISSDTDNNFCIVMIPCKYQVVKNYLPIISNLGYSIKEDISTSVQEKFIKESAKKGYCVLDPYREIKEAEQKGIFNYYSVDDHFNSNGNRLIADFVIDDFQKRRLNF